MAQNHFFWEIPALDGIPKEIGNEIAGLFNLGNDIASSLSSQKSDVAPMPEAQASSSGENAVMTATSVLLAFVPVGEAGKAGKIEKLTAEAEKLYPKKAGLEELHHIIPKYLGGAKDGEVAKLPAAYHQLITNEFRRLAPYGQKIERTAEEVGRIVQQVYSKYPLP